MTEFFAMGGYGAFVWPSYVLAAVVMIAVLAASIRAVRAREAELEAVQKLRPGRQRRRDANPEPEQT
ncbi:heme exporter protein CcmD [Magnetospirillum sp. UT-4]|uniref:heme exporter protein CcmD n=1 Tax=Magnetospirillum sp. UT-4 TaxID=2681467 RepID=UPI001382F08A|nr:heme exporter protein CcmD [Magnetospirillum sp. UT-4]CAA7617180.1 cytochrome c biogenesis protein [Magnetospirillum sp. UT-4]